MYKIESIKQLDFLLEKVEQVECFILLRNNLRSSKTIWLQEDGIYTILNEIDDSEDNLSKDELFDKTKTLVGEAMKLGSLFLYDGNINCLTDDEKEKYLKLKEGN